MTKLLVNKEVAITMEETINEDTTLLEVKINLRVPFRYQGTNVKTFTLREAAPTSEMCYIKSNLDTFADCFILDMVNRTNLFDFTKVKYIENAPLRNQLIEDIKSLLLENM